MKRGLGRALILLIVALAGCGRAAPATQTARPSPTTQPRTVAPRTATSAPSPATTAAKTVSPTPTAAWPEPQALTWRVFAADFRQPTAIAAPLDGTGRVFVVEQPGVVWIIQNGQRRPEPFLDIRDRVGNRESEQGLLGLAFHPEFAQNGAFFVNYTDLQGDTVVARYRVEPATANRADPAREEILLQVDQPYGNHNGGHLAFGPDGYLYIGLGDGGAAGDPEDRAQNLDSLLGKMLRIAVDAGPPYGIPPDNPFADGQGGRPEIWAWGLRNPWRYAFDRATGDLYIADVGQNKWEEIDFWPAGAGGGANFGWDYYEGFHPYEDEPPPGVTLVFPVAEYGHDQGCSVTGGEVYRGRALPEMTGIYLYGDFCTGRIWGLRATDQGWETRLLWETPFHISTFGLDEQGEIYLADYGTGTIYRLERAGE